MNLDQFIYKACADIQNAVNGINEIDSSYRAEMPKEIDFDCAVIFSQNGVYIVNDSITDSNQISRIKVKVYLNHYPWVKSIKK